MSTSTNTSSAVASARLGLLRTGLVLAAVFGVLGLAPLLDLGFDGTGWDVVLVVFAVLAVIVAAGCIAGAVWGWNGRRGPAILSVGLLIVSIVPSLPAFFLPIVETTAEGPGPLLAGIGLVITLAVVTLILVGLRRTSSRITRPTA